MKKTLKIFTLTLALLLALPINAFAAESGTQLNSSETVAINENSSLGQSTDCGEFSLNTFNDNGTMVYSIDIDDVSYCDDAIDYLNHRMGDPGGSVNSRAVLLPGESEYHNDNGYADNQDARSYAWKQRNCQTLLKSTYEGGQSTRWNGSVECNYIKLHRCIYVSGINLVISWPPALTGSDYSRSWNSDPIYSNIAGANFTGLVITGANYSVSFSESGDIYLSNSRVVSPETYITFNAIS